MKRIFFSLIAAGVLAVACHAQTTRTNTIYRPCPGTSGKGLVSVIPSGDISITPCVGKSVFINGTPFGTVISSLNGLTEASQTFATAANDTASWLSAGTTHTLRLPITGLDAPGNVNRTGYFSYFSSANTLRDAPFSYSAATGKFTWSNFANTSTLRMTAAFDPVESQVGIYNPNNHQGLFVNHDATGNSVVADSLLVKIGDIAPNISGAQIVVDGNNSAITMFTDDSAPADGYFSLTSGNKANLLTPHFDMSGVERFTINATLAGSTGDQTINTPAGRVLFAAGTKQITVTSSITNTGSLIFATAQLFDATCSVKSVTPANGSFVIDMTANCAGETPVAFWVVNQ